MNKYGKENFYVETLESKIPIDDLDNKEIYYIEQFDSFKNGYNTTPGGNVRRIYKDIDINNIITLFEQGTIAKDIAAKYGVDKVTIYRIIHGSGYYVYHDPQDCTKEKLNELVGQGYTNLEIANALGMKPWTVERRLKQYGIKRRRTYLCYREDFPYEKLFADISCGLKVDDICKKYNINSKTYYKIKQQYKAKIEESRE